jgi:hypothetical protein
VLLTIASALPLYAEMGDDLFKDIMHKEILPHLLGQPSSWLSDREVMTALTYAIQTGKLFDGKFLFFLPAL